MIDFPVHRGLIVAPDAKANEGIKPATNQYPLTIFPIQPQPVISLVNSRNMTRRAIHFCPNAISNP